VFVFFRREKIQESELLLTPRMASGIAGSQTNACFFGKSLQSSGPTIVFNPQLAVESDVYQGCSAEKSATDRPLARVNAAREIRRSEFLFGRIEPTDSIRPAR
jgi:hypothetical protein